MIPGELKIKNSTIVINEAEDAIQLSVSNVGDRPIQIGSHYHFYETNEALVFSRNSAYGMRLDIPAGTAVRFEPGQERTVELVALAGDRIVCGFRGLVMDHLEG